MLIAAGRRLQEAGVALADLGVRHPTLDDVFLALTGTGAEAVDREAEKEWHRR
jgi:ABC-2 type transport system ATP-binding protein